MAKRSLLACSILALAALQIGCAAMSQRSYVPRSSTTTPVAGCDRSVVSIDVVARITNQTNQEIGFNLDGDRGPPFDPWWLGYRVHSSAPGEFLALTHNSGHDSVWTRTVAIRPGASADFNVPIFGLRPSDYQNNFRIELRDSQGRSYWTPEFSLCAVARPKCDCPQRAY